jgi:Ni/Co efflux regulator RcnB
MLLASAAGPALAAADPGDRHSRREQSDSNDSRSGDSNRQHADRGNRGGGNDAPEQPQQQQDHPRAVMHVAPGGGGSDDHGAAVTHVESNNGGGNGGEHRHFNGDRGRGAESRPTLPSGQSDSTDTVRNWRGPKMVEPTRTTEDRAGSLREQRRGTPSVFRNRVPIVSNTPREGTQPPLRAESRSRSGTHHWDTRWRSNDRYDWQDWRRHHRSNFHLGLYFDPFGWSYQPWQIGWRLWPHYYSSRYWITDPWEYRLPYAPPGYRWIRYYDDAILVDTFTGEAVDVIHNFFW